MPPTARTIQGMDRMINNINNFIETQDVLIQALNNDYQQVGDEWDDEQYERFGELLAESTTAIKNSSDSLGHCVEKIKVLRDILDGYVNTQI